MGDRYFTGFQKSIPFCKAFPKALSAAMLWPPLKTSKEDLISAIPINEKLMQACRPASTFFHLSVKVYFSYRRSISDFSNQPR